MRSRGLKQSLVCLWSQDSTTWMSLNKDGAGGRGCNSCQWLPLHGQFWTRACLRFWSNRWDELCDPLHFKMALLGGEVISYEGAWYACLHLKTMIQVIDWRVQPFILICSRISTRVTEKKKINKSDSTTTPSWSQSSWFINSYWIKLSEYLAIDCYHFKRPGHRDFANFLSKPC